MEKIRQKERDMTKIKIRGMTCRHCVAAVTKALSDIEGIKDLCVDLASGEAAFREEKRVSRILIRERIEMAGVEVVD